MAQTTTNYGLLKPESTDNYNHLIYDNPNMDTIDAQMKTNSDTGVTPATCVKTGTVHTITRTNTTCPVFRFTATGDWNTGDTMIIDGVTVTPYLPNGEALVNGAYLINSDVLGIVSGTKATIFSNGVNQIPADHVTYDNTLTGLSATDVQGAIDEIGQYPKTVLSIPANTYASYNLALDAIRTAFQGLTNDEKLRSIIVINNLVFRLYQNEGVFSCISIGSTYTFFLTIHISSQLYYGNMRSDTGGNTFTDNTTSAQTGNITLYVI